MEVRLVPVGDVPREALAQALTDAFGRPFETEWLRWKHEDGPWGRAEGVVAVDSIGDILGCRVLLPWMVRCANGEVVLARRAVEAATTQRARGHGLFRRMNEHEMRRLADSTDAPFIFSTANDNSRPAYERMGWDLMAPIRHGYAVPLPGGAKLIEDGVLDTLEGGLSTTGRTSTVWSPQAMAWRVDRRSGRTYVVGRLREADGVNGMVARVLEGRIPVLMVLNCWGSDRERDALSRAMARRHRTPVVLAAVGEGAPPPTMAAASPWMRRGESHIMVWQGSTNRGLTDRSGWALGLADLEGVL